MDILECYGAACHDDHVYISARVDYALRALLALAASPDTPMTGEQVAAAQTLPVKFIENTLVDLRRTGFVVSQRGRQGGYRLARPTAEIVVADVFRALEGPLAEVRGHRPEDTAYEGAAANLQQVWVAVRAALRLVLEAVTLADILRDELPPAVAELLRRPDAWEPHPFGPTPRG